MTKAPPYRFTSLSLAILSMTLIAFAIINLQQRVHYRLPDDGVSWLDSAKGVRAWIVTPDGPGERAGIREGDLLESIDKRPIHTAADAGRQIFSEEVWSQANYLLIRNGEKFQTSLVLVPQKAAASVRYYLSLVGLIYLVVGTYILFRRWTAPKSLHFYIFCLASFILYTFSYTGKLNLFDWTVYWLQVVALLIQPALFLHFCLGFPEQNTLVRGRRYAIPCLYIPGAALAVVHVLVAMELMVFPMPLLHVRWLLDRVEFVYLAVYFLLGAVVLHRAYSRAQVPLLKQQLKWVTRGTWLAIVPFAACYAVPYFLGFIPNSWMNLSALSLVFLPVTFGYAIVRYRLMDVDVIFRRGMAYTLATAAIVAAYFGAIGLFADYFRSSIPITSRGGWILAVVVTALVFQPMVNWIQVRLDRFFNRERYDYRRTLLEFARELSSELHVDRLLEKVTMQLAETLGVDRLAVFWATDSDQFRMVKSRGVSYSKGLDTSFLDPTRRQQGKEYLFFDSVKRPYGFAPAQQKTIEQLDLHYYLPFKVKERTLGYLGLGKTRDGNFLSSEDIDLLQTLTGYVSVALENAQLYESLERRALEYQALTDFSQNIIESINAGVLACDLEGTVGSCNSAMEKLYGLARNDVVGKSLEAIFPTELLAELPQASDAQSVLSLYKFRLNTPGGQTLIVNLSAVPLVGKDGHVLGRLLIFNDLTERVNLEDQLVQAEKLSSIGLLAAGVAHEVNTPLAVITSQAQLAMRQMPPEDSLSRTLDKIVKQAFRASEIVNNLLKFSRVSGSEYSELDLNKLVRETLSLVEPMLRASKITVNAQLCPTLPMVYANPGKLQQVFMNLIINAKDAMPHGGELTIATDCEDSLVRAEVSDNGVGISPEHLSKIFDPFFTTKSTSRGTGLGLAVTYGIIRELMGKIEVQSALGRGTLFRVELPVARKAVNVA
ncbi:Multi-sensor signal transduction histidine kinase [Acidobacteriia bacterium SbA2]|nr:Multi-sensor signal transduction histidine kinase [Acidobacteriia bacterium SbA2]